jgi:hypothetical protein
MQRQAVRTSGAGALRAARQWRTRRRRREADAWIVRSERPLPGRLARRVDEPTCARGRRMLAHSLRGVVADLSPKRLPGAAPLDRPALRPHAYLLTVLADRLDDLERPVSAAGVLAVRRLLTDPDGPRYGRPLPDEKAPDAGAGLVDVVAGLAAG